MRPHQTAKESSATAIVVLGMHRSGTSAITRVINLLGAELPGDIMPPVADNNETGFWESTELADLHDRMLAAASSAWDDCLELPSAFFSSEIAKKSSEGILELLGRDFSGTGPFVIKDPRICRFVPLWVDVLERFGAEPRFVLIFRHPLEVAASLKLRDGFDENKAAHLWLRHVIDMEKGSRGFARSFLAYDALLEDWRGVVERIAADLQLHWPRRLHEAAPEVEGFLSENLRHHRISDDELEAHPQLLGWVKDAYAALRQAASGETDPSGALDRIAGALTSAERVFAPAVAAVQAELRERNTAMTRLRTDAAGEPREQLRHELADLKIAHRRQKEVYEAAIARLERAVEESIARAEAERLTGRIADLEEELEETRRDKDWLWEQWQESQGELAAIRGSKVGRPLWGLWQTYLAARRLAIRARAAKQSPDTRVAAARRTLRAAPGLLATSMLALARRGLRLVTRSLGWLYLLGDVAVKELVAVARRKTRGRAGGPPTAQAPSTNAPGKGVVGRRPRVLLMSPYPIFPPHHGGGVRLYNLVQRVAPQCDLHLLVFSASGEDLEQREALSPWARSVHFHHWQPSFEPDLWHLEPPNAALFASDDAARQVAHLLATKQIDILQLEYTELGQYGLPRFARVKTVLTEHDLAYRQHWRRRKMRFHERFPEGNAYGSSFGDWLRLTRYEIAVCRRADQIHVMSHDDGQSLSEFLDDGWRRLRVVPNAVDTAYYAPPPNGDGRRGVLYVGNFQNLPNVDALEYLVEEIWPRIRARRPSVELTVVGAYPSQKVTRYHGQSGINVIGAVPDLRPFYHEHRLMVAPIRAGSGTRLKILEAFAAGLPVVSTTLGAEGITASSGDQLLLADPPEEFASAVVTLLEQDVLWRRLADEGRRLAVEHYDWSLSAEATLRGWEELLTGPAPGGAAAAPVTDEIARDPTSADAAGRPRRDALVDRQEPSGPLPQDRDPRLELPRRH